MISRCRQFLTELLLLLPALFAYGWFARTLAFIQDDAYISYRYVANFLSGHGLVYNIGERIEGFTNFGWVIYLALWGRAGDIFIAVSRWTGLVLGAGVIILTYLLARELFASKGRVWWLLPAYLVGFNQSLAYWSPAGLETAAFAFLATWSLYLWLRRSWLLIWSLTLAVWIRPEGALAAGLLLLVAGFIKRPVLKYTLSCVATAFVLSLPLVGFKLGYYGSLLPNPFYAKTGLSLEQLSSGIEYVGLFAAHYGFYGVGLLLCLVFYRALTPPQRAIAVFAVAFAVYVVLVGGDALKVHRFFLPILAAVALMTASGLYQLVWRVPRQAQYLVLFFACLVLIGLTYWLPRDFVQRYNRNEKVFTRRMLFTAQSLKASDSTNFSVALPTIGIFGYELLGHDIIDMVGLTDSAVARHSEATIPGMETTWKERHHNSRYLLTRAPDYIMFSTGIKPSAPAERALCLYPEFLRSYRTRGWFYRPDSTRDQGALSVMFKRVAPIEGPLVPTYPVEYVEHYKEGLDYYVAGDQAAAVAAYDQALAVSPQPYNPYLVQQKALSCLLMGKHDAAKHLMDSLLAQDSAIFEAHKDLYIYAVMAGDTAKAAIHERWLKKLVPWYWPRVQATAEATRRQAQQAAGEIGSE